MEEKKDLQYYILTNFFFCLETKQNMLIKNRVNWKNENNRENELGMGSVIKVESFMSDTIFEHGAQRPKLNLAISVDLNG